MKKGFPYFLLVILFSVSCNKGVDDTTASNLIRSTFKLADKEIVEILGVSKESKTVALVKANINGKTINARIRKYDKGWQLEEVQNSFGNWLPASTIIEESENKLKVAMLDINILATGIMDYLTDRGVLPSQKGAIDISGSFYNSLQGFYLKDIPIKDPWGGYYYVFCGKGEDPTYGILRQDDEFLVFSLGGDGQKEDWRFITTSPEAGLFTSSYSSQDLVVYNGTWIRAPKSMTR